MLLRNFTVSIVILFSIMMFTACSRTEHDTQSTVQIQGQVFLIDDTGTSKPLAGISVLSVSTNEWAILEHTLQKTREANNLRRSMTLKALKDQLQEGQQLDSEYAIIVNEVAFQAKDAALIVKGFDTWLRDTGLTYNEMGIKQVFDTRPIIEKIQSALKDTDSSNILLSRKLASIATSISMMESDFSSLDTEQTSHIVDFLSESKNACSTRTDSEGRFTLSTSRGVVVLAYAYVPDPDKTITVTTKNGERLISKQQNEHKIHLLWVSSSVEQRDRLIFTNKQNRWTEFCR